ncbi:MAG: hypothetical protein GY895_00220 [Phycisphaera sp.]|nr:hypothetical protein [Phycisphaera sp.]
MRRILRTSGPIRRGTTLIELAIVGTIMLLIAALALPMLQRDAGARASATFTLLRDDLEQARHRTIADPERPVHFLLDDDGGGWSLVTGPQDRPITRHDGLPWQVRLGEGPARHLDGVMVSRVDRPHELELLFDASGVIVGEAPPAFEISDGDSTRGLQVGLVTGVVRLIDE